MEGLKQKQWPDSKDVKMYYVIDSKFETVKNGVAQLFSD